MRVCEKKKVSMRGVERAGVRVREGEDSQKKSGRKKEKRQRKRVTWSVIDSTVERVSYLTLHLLARVGKNTKKNMEKDEKIFKYINLYIK